MHFACSCVWACTCTWLLVGLSSSRARHRQAPQTLAWLKLALLRHPHHRRPHLHLRNQTLFSSHTPHPTRTPACRPQILRFWFWLR